MTEQHTIHLGTTDQREPVEVVIELREREPVAPKLSIDLEPVETYTELSIVGEVWRPDRRDINQGGQCVETIREHRPDDKDVQRLCDIWERWHLNGMMAGTRPQRDAVEEWMEGREERYDFAAAQDHLLERELLTDRGYKYGSAWLCEPLPEEIADELRAIVARLEAA